MLDSRKNFIVLLNPNLVYLDVLEPANMKNQVSRIEVTYVHPVSAFRETGFQKSHNLGYIEALKPLAAADVVQIPRFRCFKKIERPTQILLNRISNFQTCFCKRNTCQANRRKKRRFS